MRNITTSAPGKLILSGEYAVLDGAPAVSMAINRRAIVSVNASAAEPLRSVGVTDTSDRGLLQCVCRVLDIEPPANGVVLDTAQFSNAESGTKIGIGSSAALTAALVRAFSPDAEDDAQLFRLALLAHRDFQGGRGSGVDVATSVFGGLITYQQNSMPGRIAWPDGLHAAFLWSGVPASTTAKISMLSEKTPAASRDALADAARAVCTSWQSAPAEAALEELRTYVGVLREFDVDHALGIFDAGHDALTELGNTSTTIYKPCGAGGGDVGVVFGTDPAAVNYIADNAISRGFLKLDFEVDMRGASIDGAGE